MTTTYEVLHHIKSNSIVRKVYRYTPKY